MMVKWLGLLYLYALTNETSQKAFGTTITRKKNKNQMYPSGTPNWTKTMCLWFLELELKLEFCEKLTRNNSSGT